MQSSHSLGVGAVNSLVSGVQGAAKASDLSQMPGYETASPQESGITYENISAATLSKAGTEPARL